jgi:hypothetical protein
MGFGVISEATPLIGYVAQHLSEVVGGSALATAPDARIYLPWLAFPSDAWSYEHILDKYGRRPAGNLPKSSPEYH